MSIFNNTNPSSSKRAKITKGAAAKQSTLNNKLQNNFNTYPEQELFEVGGQLASVMQLILDASVYPQKIFALGGSAALISLLVGNKYKTDDEIYANLYITAIGPTGCGKDSPRSTIKELSGILQIPEKAVDSIASGPGLEDHLSSLSTPETIILMDEFGQSLQQRKSNGEDHGITGTLLKLYTSVKSHYTTRLKAGKNRTPLFKPFVSLYGTTTQETLQDALTEADAESGWIGRLLFLYTCQARPSFKKSTSLDPKTLLNLVEWYKGINEHGSVSCPKESNSLASTVVPYSETAAKKLITYQHKTDEYLRSESLNPIIRAATVRLVEMAKKLSLISAVSRNPIDPIINIHDVKWGIALVNFSKSYILSGLAPNIENKEASSLETMQMKKCLGIIKRAKTFNDSQFKQATKCGYMPKRMLLKKMGNKSRTVEDLTSTLIQSGQVIAAQLTKEEHGINCDEAYSFNYDA